MIQIGAFSLYGVEGFLLIGIADYTQYGITVQCQCHADAAGIEPPGKIGGAVDGVYDKGVAAGDIRAVHLVFLAQESGFRHQLQQVFFQNFLYSGVVVSDKVSSSFFLMYFSPHILGAHKDGPAFMDNFRNLL